MQNEKDAPEENEERLLKSLEEKFKEASKYREQFESDLSEYENFYMGKQWPTGQTKPVENVCFQLIEAITSTLSDSMPGANVLARSPDMEDAANALQAHMAYAFEYNNLHLKLTQLIRKTHISGTPYFYVSYDPDADDGLGMAVIRTLGWRMVYLDPLANDLDEVSYAIIKMPMRVAELKKMFPDFADKIKAGNVELNANGSVNNSQTENKWVYKSDNDGEGKYAVKDSAFLEEYWFKDYTMLPISEQETAEEISHEEMDFETGNIPELSKYEDHNLHATQHYYDLTMLIAQTLGVDQSQVTPDVIEQVRQDPQIGEKVSLWLDHIELHQKYIEMGCRPEKPKYPSFWRRVCKIDKTIVINEAPFIPSGMIPLVPVYCYKDDEQVYGFSETKNIIDQQKVINEMDYAYLTGVRLVGNPIRVMDKDCGVDPNTVTNRPGAIYTPKQGYRFSVEVPPMVGQDYQIVKNSKKESMKDTTGVTDSAMGKSPGSNASGKMVRLLQEQANSRLRLKSRILESYTMPRLGKIVSAYIVEYAVARQIRNKDENGKYIYVDYDPGAVKNLKYDIVTVPGTTSGADKETINNQLANALANGMISFEQYVRLTNPENKNSILKVLHEANDVQGNITQLQKENLILRAKVDPNSVSNEEVKILQEMQQQELADQAQSLNGGMNAGQ